MSTLVGETLLACAAINVLTEEMAKEAMAAASSRANGELRAARDPAAFCAARLAAIQDGGFDASRNAELAKLLAR